MADRTTPQDGGVEAPEPLLPEESVLTLEEYLAMQRAIGDETRFQLVRTLSHNGPLSATELGEALDIEGNRLHYHLNRLVDVGLVQKRKRKEADEDGLFVSYRVSALGQGILAHGVEELMAREHEFVERYR